MAVPQAPSLANCSAISIPYPTLPGANISSLLVTPEQTGFQFIPAGLYANNGAVTLPDTSYCRAVVVYSKKDLKGNTTVEVWLPSQNWNGRIQAIGGGGWRAGLTGQSKMGMTAAIGQGYAAIGTNGGHSLIHPRDWAFESPGKIDVVGLRHYAATSLNDLSIIGKSVVKSVYGQPAKYSYFNGCSQGGRQGYMIAQEYPKAFDGIVASAAALNWASLAVGGFWAQMLMHEIGFVHPCELSTLTAAAIKKCDPEDGVTDGLISDPDSCRFDSFALVNTTATCWESGSRKISKEAAFLAHTGWTGLKTAKGFFKPLNNGTTHEAALVTVGVGALGPVLEYLNLTMGLADTICTTDGRCSGKPLEQANDWIKYFILKDPTYDTAKIRHTDFDNIYDTSVREYNSIMGTNSTDLSAFREAGGKLLSFHGLVSNYLYKLT
jgi:hypothetical protein